MNLLYISVMSIGNIDLGDRMILIKGNIENDLTHCWNSTFKQHIWSSEYCITVILKMINLTILKQKPLTDTGVKWATREIPVKLNLARQLWIELDNFTEHNNGPNLRRRACNKNVRLLELSASGHRLFIIDSPFIFLLCVPNEYCGVISFTTFADLNYIVFWLHFM